MRIFCLCHKLCAYGCVICCSPLNVFAIHFAVLGMTLASLQLPWDASGYLWGDLGSQRVLLGHFDLLWAALKSVDHLGHPGLPSGAWDDFGSKMDVRLRYYLERLRCLRIKSDLGDLSPASEVSRQSGARSAAPNPTSLAPGARMT